MIELFVLWKLIRYVGGVVSARGQRALGYQVLAVICWVSGELIGFALGGVLLGRSGLWIYVVALVGAVMGAVLAIWIAQQVPGVGPVTDSDGGRSRRWTLVVPIGASLLVGMCACVSLTAATLFELVNTPPLSATSARIGSRLTTDRRVDPNGETTPYTRIVYLEYDLGTPDRSAVPVTIDWLRSGVILATQTTQERAGHHLVTFDVAEFPDGHLPPGDYQVVVHVDQAVLADLRLQVK